MDPAACLDILRAAQTDEKHCCQGGSREAPEAPESNAGQVLDVESGENETLGPLFTEEALLQRFPKLQAAEEQLDTFAEKTFDGKLAKELVLKAISLEEERVLVYKDFDAAFKWLLEAQQATRALAWLYPFVVRMATGRFQAISESVRTLATELETRRSPFSDLNYT